MTRAARSSPRASASRIALGTAIGPGGALYVTLFGTGAVVRFFPGYRP